MSIRPVFEIKCEDCVYGSKQPDGLILCSVPEGGCYKFHEAEVPRQTNGDKIREMSNEELAEYLSKIGCPVESPYQSSKECTKCWLDWVNADANEEEGESN